MVPTRTAWDTRSDDAAKESVWRQHVVWTATRLPIGGRVHVTAVARGVDVVDQLELEVLGPPDDRGWTRVLVLRDQASQCVLSYVAWAGHVMVMEVEVCEGASAASIVPCVLALHASLGASAPTRLIHHGIRRLETLVAYQRGPMAPGITLAGLFGARGLTSDPIVSLDLSREPKAASEHHHPVEVIVTYHPVMAAQWSQRQPSLEDVTRWLDDAEDVHRIATIRRVALDTQFPPMLVQQAHQLAMLNENATVRQFAAMQLSGMSEHIPLACDLSGLLSLIEEPNALLVQGHLAGQDAHAWRSTQSRRNARYAAIWTLGNIAWGACGPSMPPWMHEVTGQLRAWLRARMARVDARRDDWLYERALVDFQDGEDGRFGLGAAAPIDLFDCLRFAVIRWRMVLALGFKGTDRFYWLIESVEAIVGEAMDRPESALGEALFAPSSRDDLPLGLEVMPAWAYAENRHADSA